MKRWVYTLVCSLLPITLAAGAPPPTAKRAELISDFEAVTITGPMAGRQLPLVRAHAVAGGPVLMALVKEPPAAAAGLVAAIQQLAEAPKSTGLSAFVVFLAGPEAKDEIEQLAEKKRIDLTLGYLPLGREQKDLAPYRLSPTARNTIILYRDETIQARFVNIDDKTFPQVTEAVAKMIRRRAVKPGK